MPFCKASVSCTIRVVWLLRFSYGYQLIGANAQPDSSVIRSFRFFLIWSISYRDIKKRYQEVTGVYQPCTCLCLGFSQIILMRPFLLMTLHFSHIGFTELLTFISKPSFQKRPFSNIPQGMPRGKHFFISIRSGKNGPLISVWCDDYGRRIICLSRWYVPW